MVGNLHGPWKHLYGKWSVNRLQIAWEEYSKERCCAKSKFFRTKNTSCKMNGNWLGHQIFPKISLYHSQTKTKNLSLYFKFSFPRHLLWVKFGSTQAAPPLIISRIELSWVHWPNPFSFKWIYDEEGDVPILQSFYACNHRDIRKIGSFKSA